MKAEELREQLNEIATSEHTLNILARNADTGVVFCLLSGIWRTQIEILKRMEAGGGLINARAGRTSSRQAPTAGNFAA